MCRKTAARRCAEVPEVQALVLNTLGTLAHAQGNFTAAQATIAPLASIWPNA
ncbi:MAG TPA: hypothetical protein VKY74_22750 [Chloroflexia bacterium]|nr:hypothetical protein [Chloroflexia bacterium]